MFGGKPIRNEQTPLEGGKRESSLKGNVEAANL